MDSKIIAFKIESSVRTTPNRYIPQVGCEPTHPRNIQPAEFYQARCNFFTTTTTRLMTFRALRQTFSMCGCQVVGVYLDHEGLISKGFWRPGSKRCHPLKTTRFWMVLVYFNPFTNRIFKVAFFDPQPFTMKSTRLIKPLLNATAKHSKLLVYFEQTPVLGKTISPSC